MSRCIRHLITLQFPPRLNIVREHTRTNRPYREGKNNGVKSTLLMTFLPQITLSLHCIANGSSVLRMKILRDWLFWFSLDPFPESTLNLLAPNVIEFVGLLQAISEHGSTYFGIGNLGHSRCPPEGAAVVAAIYPTAKAIILCSLSVPVNTALQKRVVVVVVVDPTAKSILLCSLSVPIHTAVQKGASSIATIDPTA